MRSKCFNCGEYGHYANKCERSAKKQHLLHAVHTQEKQRPKVTQWCVDSGATSHMCCDRGLFTNFMEHEEIRFEANKSILAKRKGDVDVIINSEQIKLNMFRKKMVKGMNLKDDEHVDHYNTCMYSKIHVQPFPQETSERTEDLLEVIHRDVCGPFNLKSCGGARYFVTFIDDFLGRIFVYFFKAKSEVLEIFKIFKQHIEK